MIIEVAIVCLLYLILATRNMLFTGEQIPEDLASLGLSSIAALNFIHNAL